MMKLLFAPFVALIIADVFTTLEGSSIKIDIRSEGCNDPGKTPNTCGIAYIKVNDNEHSKKKRGHNVVVLDAVTGIVEHSVSFDTHGNGAAGNQLKGFLNGITGDKIILIAVQDEGSIHLKQAFDALTRVGGYDLGFLDYRGSYALVGHPARQKPSYVKQVQSKSGQGPSVISMTVPLMKNPFVDIDIRSEGCNDPNRTLDTCGIAYIKVDGEDHSRHLRGHNVVIVDQKTASVLKSEAFDTHGDESAGNRLGVFLDAQEADKIILIAVQDEGSIHLKQAFDALKRVGGYDLGFLDYRGSYALVGHAGEQRPSYVKQVQSKSGQGPSVISMTVPLTISSSIKIDIRSEGCNDPGKTPNTCGIAYIKVNGNEHSKKKRGHNVVVLDAVTGIVEHSVSFDTHGNGAAGNQLKGFLNGITGDKIILIAVQDEGSIHLKQAFDALKRIGGYDLDFLDYRGSYALVGHAGEQRPSYVKQVQSKSGQGPSVISMTVPLTISVIDEGDDKCEPNIV